MTMESAAETGGSAAEIRPSNGAPLTGNQHGGPRPMASLHHAPTGVSVTPADESRIRHHERQLAATELLILAERHSDPYVGGQLTLAAVAISRRQVA